MRVIIAGSRSVELDVLLMDEVVRASGFVVDRVVCGLARGMDTSGLRWAEHHGIAVDRFPADWKKHGRSAGYKRNVEMSEHADALIAVMCPGGSRGTQHMIDIARRKRLQVFVTYWPAAEPISTRRSVA
jgi:hypothetical protein